MTAGAEVWLDSMLRALALEEDEGSTCDVRYLGSDATDLFYEALDLGLIDETSMKRDLRNLSGFAKIGFGSLMLGSEKHASISVHVQMNIYGALISFFTKNTV